ncbi:Heterokaryon incompatibility [Penicillium concentricum]|uniref:Heterokaryon incompatibility n=1 Tax=Penicillium concentricum TaxID=293559 RepID=A0A9W9RN04_9EURO|nr:Heterokaryon incompatibility [Penicillium concentricum]KAJ5360553.1 Heterokaryon incompatibility [Penicillium concentricum]
MADHLFLPDNPPRPLRIEYDGPLYDGGDWDTFPTRCGWLDESGTENFPPDAVPSEYQSMMECWLYFGMLHYIFGDQLDQSEFLLREEEGDQYITTRHLQKYVEDVDNWKNNEFGARSVEIVKKVLENLPRYIPWIREKMSFAIRLVSLTLWKIVIKRDGPQEDPRGYRLWFLTREEARQMIREGWCPLDTEKCHSAGLELDTQAYLRQLAPSKARWNNRTHESCKMTECVADNIDESSYVTRHVQEGCSCSLVDSDIEQLHTILQGGGIPLVMITPSSDELGNQHYELKVVKKRTGKPYVAISHIWADGLGNPRGNSLPHCQLGFLYKQAKPLLQDKEHIPYYDEKTYGPLHTGAIRLAHFAVSTARIRDNSVLVWIDTLCIPHQSDVRSLAIQRIRDVYTSASRTLILDSGLMLLDSSSSTKLEVCLRVLYYSGWIRRLWTLQEGLAAKNKLYVLLSDKAVNIGTIPDVLLNKADRGEIPICQDGVATTAVNAWYWYFQYATNYASLFDRYVLIGITQGKVIARTWFNVATRASSKDRDRATVLAGLLNLDLGKILEVKEADDRMRTLYSMLDEFPQDVLFLDGLRFEEDGLRWAVKVCRYTRVFSQLIHNAGKITPRGIQITLYSSLIFPCSKMFNLVKANKSDPDQRQRDLEQWANESEFGPDGLGTGTKVLHLETNDLMDLNLNETYGIILRSPQGHILHTVTACGLVSLQATEDGVHYGRYITPGYIDAITLNNSELPDEGFLMRGTWDDVSRPEWIVC